MTNATIEVAEALDAAAALIELDGWFALTGGLPSIIEGDGRFCAYLAIGEATHYELNGRLYNLVRTFFEDYVGDQIPYWNDRQSCAADVTSTMREAAEKIRANLP